MVNDLLKAQIQAEDYIKSDPTGAQTSANTELTSLSGKPLKASVLPAAFKEITFTNDPDASSLTTDAQQAKAVGLLTSDRPQRHLRPRPSSTSCCRRPESRKSNPEVST